MRLFMEYGKTVKVILFILFLLCFGVQQTYGDDAGGSAARALAESASKNGGSASIQTGAATYSIPISVSPGRLNLAPNLSLNYSSYQKNGWVGVGWNLDMGAILRSTKFGLDYDADDYLVNVVGSTTELIKRPSWGQNYYGSKTEGAFSKYFKEPSGGFVQTTKPGMKYYFGSNDDSRLYDSSDPGKIFKWCLDRVEDTNGNYINISYEKDTDGQIYLKQVDYTGKIEGLEPNKSVKFELESRPDIFSNYSSHFKVDTSKRLHRVTVWVEDTLIRSYDLSYDQSATSRKSLLNEITISDGLGSELNSYNFRYQNGKKEFGPMELWDDKNPKRVERYRPTWSESGIIFSGFWDVNGDGLVDRVHHQRDSNDMYGLWVAINNGSSFDDIVLFDKQDTPAQNYPHWGGESANQYSIFRDVNRDGLLDRVHHYNYEEEDHGLYVSLNNGTSFDPMTEWSDVQIGWDDDTSQIGQNRPRWGGAGVSDRSFYSDFVDVNGDGLADRVHHHNYDNGEVGIWAALNNGTGFDEVKILLDQVNQQGQNYPRWGQSNDNQYSIFRDVNGDGLPDRVHHRNYDTNDFGLYVSLNNGTTFDPMNEWCDTGEVGANRPRWTGTAVGARSIYSDFVDVNGDGLVDRVHHKNYETEETGLWATLNNGTGFEELVLLDKQNRNEQNFPAWGGPVDNKYSMFLDVNGDGLPDRVHHYNYDTNAPGLYVSINNGTSFEPLTAWIETGGGQSWPRYTHHEQGAVWSDFVDVNGDGLPDRVHHHNHETDQPGLWVQLNQAKHDLLVAVSNDQGGKTIFSYTPSTRWPRSEEYPHRYLPQILQTVSSVTVGDGLGNFSTTNYSYRGGYFSLKNREFRGFEEATAEILDKNGVVVKGITTRFYQDDLFKGRQEWVKTWIPGAEPEDIKLLSRVYFNWEDAPSGKATFIKLNNKISNHFDDGILTITTQENFVYNNYNGNLLSKTVSGPDAEDITTQYSYKNRGEWVWRMTKETVTGEESGQVRQTTFVYELGTGNLESEEYWLQNRINPIVTFGYDEYGNRTTVTDANGNPPTVTVYDEETHTYPWKVTNAKGHTVEYRYDQGLGVIDWEKDVNGNIVDYTYDSFGRLIQVDLPNGGQTTTEYIDAVLFPNDEINIPSHVITKVKENESGSTIDANEYFDGLGRTVQTVKRGETGNMIVTRAYHDEFGRNYLNVGPFFAPSKLGLVVPSFQDPFQQTRYDDHNRPKEILSPEPNGEGQVTTTFDYNGLETTIIDPDGNSKKEKKDYLGRLIEVTEDPGGLNYLTTYIYNAAGDLLIVADHHGNQTTIAYDTLGRKESMVDPDMGSWTYTYDANGNLKTQTDAKAQTIGYIYDELNRIEKKDYSMADPVNNPDVIYSYNDDGTCAVNGIGMLCEVTNGDVTTQYLEYDELGQLVEMQKSFAGHTTTYSTLYSYDLAGNPQTTTYPVDNYSVTNNYYPGTGLLQQVTGSDGEVFAYFTGYQADGKVGQIEHGNGTATLHTYYPTSLMLDSIVTDDASGADIQLKSYRYTNAGNIHAINDQLRGVAYVYSYDELHRLRTETNTGSYDELTYNYDAIGNITSKTVGPNSYTYSHANGAGPHAVTGVTVNGGIEHGFSYDDNGNMTFSRDLTDPANITRLIDYNADNMPTRVTHSTNGVTDIVYDGDGVRAWKTNGAKTSYYIGEHFENIDGATTKYIFAAGMRVAEIKNGIITYYHKDHLGSTTAMTDGSGGAVTPPTEMTEYTPFGVMREAPVTEVSNYNFTDQELDPETGLYNYGARFYDPMTGRFISPDSIVQDFSDPQTLNRYSYCRNNPLIYTDPTGHFIESVFAAIVGALVGGTIEELSGGDFIDGLLPGAISGLFFFGAGEYIAGLGGIEKIGEVTAAGIHATAGVLSGGINSAVAGEDIGLGMLTGGISGGIGMYAGVQFGLEKMDTLGDFTKSLAGRTVVGGITGGITAEIYGGNFSDGFVNGARTGAIGFLCNAGMHKGGNWLREWVAQGPLERKYNGWDEPKNYRPSEANIQSGIYIPGYSSVGFRWTGTVEYKQYGKWSYFKGMFSGKSHNRSWSKTVQHIGGGYNIPAMGYSYAAIGRPDAPPNFYRYAVSQGF